VHLFNEISYPESVNERVLFAISKNAYPDFLPVTCDKGKKKTLLDCDISGRISLSAYFQNRISQKKFLDIIELIVGVIKKCDSELLNISSLCLEKEYIFVDQQAESIKFIFWPIVNNQLSKPVGTFLKEIINDLKLDAYQSGEFISKYNAFFDTIEPFSLNKFEKMIASFLDDKSSKKPGTGPLDHQDAHKKQDSKHVNPDSIEYDPFLGILNSTTQKAIKTKKILSAESQSSGHGRTNLPLEAFLIRQKNQQKIIISKPDFLIGKAKQGCDYRVEDNVAVSRNHARIYFKNNKYYISDLNSSNKTYVNNIVIQPEINIELNERDLIRLGNEEFTFYISR